MTDPKIRIGQTSLAIQNCTRCPLHRTCRQPVPFRGPVPAQFAMVGEAPGAEEDASGSPFVGRAGQLLDGLLTFAGMVPGDFFVCNVVCCRPPGNRTPREEELKACRSHLEAQLELADPRFVLLLGATAISAFRPGLSVTRDHGKPWLGVDERFYFPTFHPAAAMRNSDWRDELTLDLITFRAFTRSEDPVSELLG